MPVERHAHLGSSFKPWLHDKAIADGPSIMAHLRETVHEHDLARQVLHHLRDTGTDVVVPRLRDSDRDLNPRPWIDEFSAGYIQRMTPLLPKQGDRDPWIAHQDHRVEQRTVAKAPIDDDVLQFARARAPLTL